MNVNNFVKQLGKECEKIKKLEDKAKAHPGVTFSSTSLMGHSAYSVVKVTNKWNLVRILKRLYIKLLQKLT